MCTVLLTPGVNPIAVKYIISYHIISNDAVASARWNDQWIVNGRECGRKGSWQNTKYYTGNRLDELRKTHTKPQTLQLVFVPRYAPSTFHTWSRCLPLQWDSGWQLAKIYPVFTNKQTNKQTYKEFVVVLKNSHYSTNCRTSTTSFCCTVILNP
jgi:hypothetical protein